MAILQGQLANVVEWQETRDDIIFWKWGNRELKKSSRLVIRPGQDAIFLYNGKIEGVFKDEGNYEIESQIIPFLSTLKGFKFGFNSGLRAEVVFVNSKEFSVKWGTKNALTIPAPGLPGGMPVRAFGLFNFKVDNYITFIDKVAGIKQQYSADEVKDRVTAVLDGLLMRGIAKEGNDMFNLQASAVEIGKGIQTDLNAELQDIGLTVTGFSISSFNYPEEVQKKLEQSASYHMVGDVDKYSKISMVDSMASGKAGGGSAAGSTASDMAGMMMGMQMAREMMGTASPQQPSAPAAATPAGAKFCSQCGGPLSPGAKFCPECGTKIG